MNTPAEKFGVSGGVEMELKEFECRAIPPATIIDVHLSSEKCGCTQIRVAATH